MVVIDTTIQCALMSIFVGYQALVQQDTVRNESDGVLLNGICGVQSCHCSLAVNNEVASEVELRERPVEHHVAIGITADIMQERLCEGLAELNTGTCGLDIQVDILTHGRDITIDKGL